MAPRESSRAISRSEQVRSAADAGYRGGFTLAELLVAMAIFLSIMAGVAVLFAGSIDTVRQGYRNMEAFEIGRSTLGILEQDLKTAFTARELGQYYQFYGAPNGFMFVGQLDDGQIGRVTYAVHHTVNSRQFQTILTEQFGNPNPGFTPTDPPPTGLAGRLIRQGIETSGFSSVNLELERAIRQTVQDWFNLWDPAWTPDKVAEVPAMIQTGGLIRVVERGQTDLKTFKLPDGLSWPQFVPDRTGEDTIPFGEVGFDLYSYVVSAINPRPATTTYDIRSLMYQVPLNAIGPETVQQILDARKRDIWISMVAGDPNFGALSGFWSNLDPDNPDLGPEDFLVADTIVVSANLMDLNGNILTWPVLADGMSSGPVNGLYHAGFFFYANSVQAYSNHYNTLVNIEPPRMLPGPSERCGNMISYQTHYAQVSQASGAAEAATYLEDLDCALAETLGGTRLANDTLGSPLLPQLPSMVRPGFWILKPATRPGGADLRRWFSQSVDVPSAFNRSVEASMQANPSQV